MDFSEKNDIFYLQPNPANDEVALIFSALEKSTYRIQIYHADGVCCLKNVVVANSGMNQTKLDISGLPKGVYIVVLEDDSSHRVSRLVHQ